MKKEILERYLAAFDEINALTSISYKSAGEDVSQIKDDILSFLVNAYELGIQSVSQMLDCPTLPVDVSQLQKVIYTKIDGKNFENRADEHFQNGDLARLQILVESEFHRVYNSALNDGAKRFSNLYADQITKTWITVGDERVRDTHRYLEQATVPIDSEFYTYDNDHAPYPGAFTKAENNVGCRCIIEYRKV
jgi:hypothetical protein